MSNFDGTFIVFEGGEGSGKDTQINRVKERLPSDTVFTREPGGTPTAEAIRKTLLGEHYGGMSVKTELLLFCAARADHIEKAVKPALKEGKTVISNRFDLSTFSYQIYGRERPEYNEFLQLVNSEVVEGCVPDVYIYLDVPVKIGHERVQDRGEENTRFDDEAAAFHERVREGYKKLCSERDNCIVIDTSKSIDEVAQEVEQVLKDNLNL